jgi:hypothetical protein
LLRGLLLRGKGHCGEQCDGGRGKEGQEGATGLTESGIHFGDRRSYKHACKHRTIRN